MIHEDCGYDREHWYWGGIASSLFYLTLYELAMGLAWHFCDS